MARSKSSSKWLNEHFSDQYVQKAQKMGYRSRAAFKLEEIQQKDKLIKPGMSVVDLGAAPGGWSQVARQYCGDKGKIIALDILPMDHLAEVEFIQGDFREDQVYQKLMSVVGDNKIDLVLSDMAPNISGIKSSDQARAMYLVELALDFSSQVLRPGGNFLVKVFQGQGFDAFHKQMKQAFSKVISRKPQASRARSTEIYLLGKDLKN